MEEGKGFGRRDFLKGLSAATVAAGSIGSSASASDKKFWDRFRHHRPSREVDFGLPVTRDKENVEFIGWNDLQGRSTLQVTAKGDWLFVGHHHCPDFAAFPFPRLLQNDFPGSWDLRDSARLLGRLPVISFKLFF